VLTVLPVHAGRAPTFTLGSFAEFSFQVPSAAYPNSDTKIVHPGTDAKKITSLADSTYVTVWQAHSPGSHNRQSQPMTHRSGSRLAAAATWQLGIGRRFLRGPRARSGNGTDVRKVHSALQSVLRFLQASNPSEGGDYIYKHPTT